MGYTTRTGTSITDFTPDDTDTDLYLSTDWVSIGLDELLDKIKEKWPEHQTDEIMIAAEKIHTHCLGYDRHDSGDHTNYLHIQYKPLKTLKIVGGERDMSVTELALTMREFEPELNPMKLRDRLIERMVIGKDDDTLTILKGYLLAQVCLRYNLRLVFEETPQ